MDVRRALFIAMLALLVAAPVAHAGKRRVPQGFYGATYDRGITRAPERDQDAQAALMARSGVESVRVVFSWADAQPTPGEPPSFATTDALVARSARRAMTLLPVVINTPLWARQYPSEDGSPPYDPNDYASYLRALVARYGPAGSFWQEHPELPRRPLRQWQVWNEPHLQGFWFSLQPWQDTYVDLLSAAHAAVKQVDPGAKIVLASLADFSWRHLQRVYDAGGRGLFDVVAMNFFTARPSDEVRGVRKVRVVLRRNGQSRLAVWLTEISWPAAKGRDRPRAAWQRPWYQTDRGMATRLTQAYEVLARNRRALRLGRVYWYTWSSGYRRGDLFDFGGLLKYDGSRSKRRPALRAYQRSARLHEGCAKTSSGVCRR